MSVATDIVREHMAAEDRQDLEATLATFTDDCWYSVPGLGLELRGRDQIRGWYEDTFTAFPDFRNADERCWEGDGGNVFFEAKMEGTHLGELAGWAPTGRRFSTPLFCRIPIAPDGRIEAEVVYFDGTNLMRQLGLLPDEGSSAERVLQRVHRLRHRWSGRRR